MIINGYELNVVCSNKVEKKDIYNSTYITHGKIYDNEEYCLIAHPNDEIIYGYSLKNANKESIPNWFDTLDEAIEWAKDTYGCDGLNSNCMGNINVDNVHWFTSGLGFCDCCHDRIFEQIGDNYEDLYDKCVADDKDAVDKVVSMTE